jgi:hypothetical protein
VKARPVYFVAEHSVKRASGGAEAEDKSAPATRAAE